MDSLFKSVISKKKYILLVVGILLLLDSIIRSTFIVLDLFTFSTSPVLLITTMPEFFIGCFFIRGFLLTRKN